MSKQKMTGKFGLALSLAIMTAGLLTGAGAAYAQASNLPTPAAGPVVLTEPGQPPRVTILGESAGGQTVKVAQGSAVKIELSENLSTGYYWHVRVKSGSVGYIQHSYRPGPAMPGAPGTAVFAFNAGRKGVTTLVFTSARAAGSANPAETVEITIDAQ